MASGRLFLKLVMFWLPVPVTLGMVYLWRRQTGSSLITAYAVLMPLSYGYLMPHIAINVLKRWRFKNGVMMGGMYIHHGFMYASKMSLFGFLPLVLLGNGAPDQGAAVAWIACSALPYAFTAWLQDALCLRHGFVEFDRGPEELSNAVDTLSYAPLCFTIIGVTYTSGLVALYVSCLSGTPSLSGILIIFTLSFAALLTLPAIAYRAMQCNENS